MKENGDRKLLHLSVHSATHHTAEKQLHGLQDQVSLIYATYNETIGHSPSIVDARSFPSKLRGVCTDHAADQKLLAELLKDWKKCTDRESRGEEKLLSLPPEELIAVLLKASQEDIQAAVGLDGWNALSESEKLSRNAAKYQDVCFQIGQKLFAALKPKEQEESDWFVRVGCCMHKQLNTIKGGAAAIRELWIKLGIEGPMKYFNKDNSAAYHVGDEASRTRAMDASQSGAVKLTSLSGSLFNHKDDKKGHQGSLAIFFEGKTGRFVRFPDTSNTRYQSHCEAAAELIVQLDLYIVFLEEIKEKKDNRTFNNLEIKAYRTSLPSLKWQF
ncbi:hypothetical protein M422DRAFT_254077 [Sphaerobolus stellatus SS14]|uniref:Unplaced genomic scaffold SPHSTscaffold_53, whole genome shotgun sequence n=1 Tax=Sphaerobolus stellatus (strain SS14) TaxID=990650 RepID=A0A0C9UHR9_SPHS4|nr:hypothetical protein M422DRAFT_254077 [Sphaerobolus stellatus SS14]